MKTISEMQLLIKDAYSKLDELSKSLSEYNLSSDVNMTVDFEKLKVLGKRNPIEGHALSKADQLTKKYYVILLIALVYLATENQEKGWLLIQRIACGAKIEYELSDLSVDALSLTDKQFDSLSESIISANLRTAFALDCMLVYLSCEHKNKKMLDLISELMELVKCTKDEVKEVVELSSLIATQNTTGYFAKCLMDMSVNLMESLCYIMPTKATVVNSLEEAMKINKEHVIIFNSVISKVSALIDLDDFPAKTIEFFHCKFDNIIGLKSQNKKVIFKNTIFSNITHLVESNNQRGSWFSVADIYGGNASKSTEKFSILEINNCELLGCHFLNCTTSEYFIYIQKGNISNCIFEQCSGVNTRSGIYLLELISGDIKGCKFEHCSITTNSENRGSTTTGIVKLSQGTIKNTHFIDCNSYGDSSYGRYATYCSYILFLSNASAEQCNFIRCVCTSQNSSDKICTHYIIALQNSNQRNNIFTECSSYHYKYSDCGGNVSVGAVK